MIAIPGSIPPSWDLGLKKAVIPRHGFRD